ncbi:hypothetical protein [Streptomyces acidiscabies]|uniref:Uncharacterized protein n=1 Tax=Streptomyces acidiscabies TaxID=42234 RepID=A0ABU4MAW1_9ACTN|nr:hypothetical protein [Streptomyces acidiscabies]MDX3024981.1 hypothetical protein [Streptomyces acidiscabies]
MQITTGDLSGGGRPSEDRILVSTDSTLVVVLDGVSTLTEETPRGGWYAQTLGEEILAVHERGQHLDLRTTLNEAIYAVARKHKLVCRSSPAATVAIVRHRPDDHMVDGLVLCDTPIVVEQRDGFEVLRDERLESLVRLSPDREVMFEQLRAGRGFQSPEHRQVVKRLRDHQMQHINRTGDPLAYWVAEAAMEAADQAVVRSWPVSDIKRMWVMTDGALAGIEPYGLWTWDAFADACTGLGPQQVVETIDAYERNDDPRGVKHPRYKIADDKALVCITFGTSR